MEWGAGRQRLGVGHGQSPAGPSFQRHQGGAGMWRAGTGGGPGRAWLCWLSALFRGNRGLEAGWGAEGGRSLLRDALASSLLALDGSWCYLLISEGLGMEYGEIKSLPSAGTEQCGPVPIPLLQFTFLPFLKRNAGFAEPLPCIDFPFIFQCPRAAHGESPSPQCSTVHQAQPKPFSCNLPQ